MFTYYEGPGLTAEPLAVLVTGVLTPSANAKTGPMAQVYIINTKEPPAEAVSHGGDVNICGDCPHRGGSCYVQTHRLGHVWRAYQAGKYQPVTADVLARQLNLLHRPLRISAYGDPAAVPFELWENIIPRLTAGHTGYTHLWRRCHPGMKQWFMASVDSENEAVEASSQGWATFRVRLPTEPSLSTERTCPASNEAGKQVQCVHCMRCAGRAQGAEVAPHIVTQVHGSASKINKFKSMKEPAYD